MPTRIPQAPSSAWKLAEAKANFSKVVRLAAAGHPQRVTVNGRGAAVVVSTAEFERLNAPTHAPTLHDLLSRSPLNRLQFERKALEGPVRKVEI